MKHFEQISWADAKEGLQCSRVVTAVRPMVDDFVDGCRGRVMNTLIREISVEFGKKAVKRGSLMFFAHKFLRHITWWKFCSTSEYS